MKTEIQNYADFTQVRYANCWEDADILVKALEPEGRHCLSIGSAGDNSFSLLAEGAAKVTVAEMNPSQVACIKLRVAAYRNLEYDDFLILLGDVREQEEGQRSRLFEKVVCDLDEQTLRYWRHFSEHIDLGFGQVGKFEAYFKLFREKVLPLVHSREKIAELLSEGKTQRERASFYQKNWNSWRWRLLFRVFFSRYVMGKMGRDPAFFKYVEGTVADRILDRANYALVQLDPAENPYLHWILNGCYGDRKPHALRAENYDLIKKRLDRIEVIEAPVETALMEGVYEAFNLSDIFEYMSVGNTEALLRGICDRSEPGARLAYWNMLAPRSRPEAMRAELASLDGLANDLFAQDKAFFYSKFIVEETL